MFEDLNWRSAARRSAVVIAIYLGLLYVLSVAFPDSSFSLDTRGRSSASSSTPSCSSSSSPSSTPLSTAAETGAWPRPEQKKPGKQTEATRRQSTPAQGPPQPEHEPQEGPPPALTLGLLEALGPRSKSPGSWTPSPSSRSPGVERARTTTWTPSSTPSRSRGASSASSRRAGWEPASVPIACGACVSPPCCTTSPSP